MQKLVSLVYLTICRYFVLALDTLTTNDVVHSFLISQCLAIDWIQLGGDIDGEAAGDRSGLSVSLSSDGNTLGKKKTQRLCNTFSNKY